MIPHIYIHIPFCTSKCDYCGFYSETVITPKVIQSYPKLLLQELRLRVRDETLQPQTIYLGGGTPSLLGDRGFMSLTGLLRDFLDLNRVEEWSVELNPASVTPELLESLLDGGINRLTFGAQSFENAVLKNINRAHIAEKTINGIKAARKAGFTNIGIDLIAGLPGTDHAIWQRDINKALELNPTHLSVYCLSIEPGTPLQKRVCKGLKLPDDKEQLNRLLEAEEKLTEAGFTRYEISNYALPGYECRHNRGIWRGNDYLGIGPAAASRIGQNRIENNPDLKEYIKALSNNIPPPCTEELLSRMDDAEERVLFALRLKEGFSPELSARRFPQLRSRVAEWEQTLTRLTAGGFVENTGNRSRLTARGREICDSVIRELI
jgi:oxygen-independent coproporphyrinogen-3 oxidase